MLMRNNKKTLYSITVQKEMKREQILNWIIKGFAIYVVGMLIACFFALFL